MPSSTRILETANKRMHNSDSSSSTNIMKFCIINDHEHAYCTMAMSAVRARLIMEKKKKDEERNAPLKNAIHLFAFLATSAPGRKIYCISW